MLNCCPKVSSYLFGVSALVGWCYLVVYIVPLVKQDSSFIQCWAPGTLQSATPVTPYTQSANFSFPPNATSPPSVAPLSVDSECGITLVDAVVVSSSVINHFCCINTACSCAHVADPTTTATPTNYSCSAFSIASSSDCACSYASIVYSANGRQYRACNVIPCGTFHNNDDDSDAAEFKLSADGVSDSDSFRGATNVATCLPQIIGSSIALGYLSDTPSSFVFSPSPYSNPSHAALVALVFICLFFPVLVYLLVYLCVAVDDVRHEYCGCLSCCPEISDEEKHRKWQDKENKRYVKEQQRQIELKKAMEKEMVFTFLRGLHRSRSNRSSLLTLSSSPYYDHHFINTIFQYAGHPFPSRQYVNVNQSVVVHNQYDNNNHQDNDNDRKEHSTDEKRRSVSVRLALNISDDDHYECSTRNMSSKKVSQET